jgi:hypothetical protein
MFFDCRYSKKIHFQYFKTKHARFCNWLSLQKTAKKSEYLYRPASLDGVKSKTDPPFLIHP